MKTSISENGITKFAISVEVSFTKAEMAKSNSCPPKALVIHFWKDSTWDLVELAKQVHIEDQSLNIWNCHQQVWFNTTDPTARLKRCYLGPYVAHKVQFNIKTSSMDGFSLGTNPTSLTSPHLTPPQPLFISVIKKDLGPYGARQVPSWSNWVGFQSLKHVNNSMDLRDGFNGGPHHCFKGQTPMWMIFWKSFNFISSSLIQQICATNFGVLNGPFDR